MWFSHPSIRMVPPPVEDASDVSRLRWEASVASSSHSSHSSTRISGFATGLEPGSAILKLIFPVINYIATTSTMEAARHQNGRKDCSAPCLPSPTLPSRQQKKAIMTNQILFVVCQVEVGGGLCLSLPASRPSELRHRRLAADSGDGRSAVEGN